MRCSRCSKIWHVGEAICPYCGGEPVDPPERSDARLDRRQFIIGTAAAGIAVAGVAGGMAYTIARDSDDGDAVPPGQETPEPTPTGPPAQPVDVDEISRHPIEMPPSADYTLYQDGEYQNFVERDGPITQEVHFNISEVVAEMVEGTTMEFWTFDGTVPGPMVRSRVGDTLDFFLHNASDSKMPHNVDFHAVNGPGGGSVALGAEPGATSNLRVKLLAPGIYVYHCAFPDIPTHIAHGMYGLAVVEPEEGLPPVDHEYYLMQSEFYTEKGGRQVFGQLRNAGHLAYSLELGNMEEPTFVVFNGRPDSITGDRAIGVHNGDTINTGDTVRLFVGNIGPNLISSFHVIGEIFNRVYVEGSFSLVNQHVQTTLVPAGGAVGVEFTVEVPGDYVIVDHAIFRIHKGAAGIIQAQGPENPEVFEPVAFNRDLRFICGVDVV